MYMHTHIKSCKDQYSYAINRNFLRKRARTHTQTHTHTGHIVSALFEKANNVGVEARHPELRQVRLCMRGGGGEVWV